MDASKFTHPFCDLLRERIKTLGYSLGEIEEKTEIAKVVVSRWQTGNLKMGTKTLPPPSPAHAGALAIVLYPNGTPGKNIFLAQAADWLDKYKAAFFPDDHKRIMSLRQNKARFSRALEDDILAIGEIKAEILAFIKAATDEKSSMHQGDLLTALMNICGISRPELLAELKWSEESLIFSGKVNIGFKHHSGGTDSGRAPDFANFLRLKVFGVEEEFFEALRQLQKKSVKAKYTTGKNVDQVFAEAVSSFDFLSAQKPVSGHFVNHLCQNLIKEKIIPSKHFLSAAIGKPKNYVSNNMKLTTPTDSVLCEIADEIGLGAESRKRLREIGFKDREQGETLEEIIALIDDKKISGGTLLERIRVAKDMNIIEVLSNLSLKRNYFVQKEADDVWRRSLWHRFVSGKEIPDQENLSVILTELLRNESVEAKLAYAEKINAYFGYELDKKYFDSNFFKPSTSLTR